MRNIQTQAPSKHKGRDRLLMFGKHTLVPSPSPPSSLQYARMKEKGLGGFIMWVTSMSTKVDRGQLKEHVSHTHSLYWTRSDKFFTWKTISTPMNGHWKQGLKIVVSRFYVIHMTRSPRPYPPISQCTVHTYNMLASLQSCFARQIISSVNWI